MKRFYKLVSTAEEKGGYAIFLDGRAVKTRAGRRLVAQNAQVADLIMREWVDQKDYILPDTMPMTQILNTKIDRVADERPAMSEAALKYLDTDLLCYFAEEPQELVKRQQDCRQVWLDWFSQTFGVALSTTQGLRSLVQDQAAHQKVKACVSEMDDNVFTVFQIVTSLSGSIVLALAFVHGKASPEDVLCAAFVEEDYKEALYDTTCHGPDPMLEKAKQSKRRDLDACAAFLGLR